MWKIPKRKNRKKQVLLNHMDEHNMKGKSFTPGFCAVCGKNQFESHHVVSRSHGGTDGPILHLCGCGENLLGSELHHGMAHSNRLFFWWCDGTDRNLAPGVPDDAQMQWAFLLCEKPMNQLEALRTDGWQML